MHIKCACGNTDTTDSKFVGSATQIGWHPIICRDGHIFYVCPTCLPKLKESASLIARYSNVYAVLNSLLDT